MKQISRWFSENVVVVFFTILCILAYVIAGQAPYVVMSDLINRVMRNSIMVLALIIPILAGMGLNFGIVVGAMSAQAAIIFITHWRLGGIAGILAALVISTVISVICGYLLGRLFNKTRGQEMITGMIAGYFGNGIYLLIFLVLLGTIIPFWDPELSISTGIGIKDTLNMQKNMKGALDQVFELKFSVVLMIIFGLFTLHTAWKAVKKKEDVKKLAIRWVIWGVVLAVVLNAPVLGKVVAKCDVPIITLLFIILVSVLCQYITKTKLGQDFRSVGSDIKIAEASGINVDRIRILATIFSTVLAGDSSYSFKIWVPSVHIQLSRT